MKDKNQQKRKQLAEEWFLKGSHDIETAQLLFDERGYNEVESRGFLRKLTNSFNIKESDMLSELEKVRN